MKFVRHETKGFFLFPRGDRVWHAHVANFLGDEGVISAGFVKFTDCKLECFGFSESIGIGCGKNDTKDLIELLGLHSENSNNEDIDCYIKENETEELRR